MMTKVSQLWDLIGTWCFHKDIINIKGINNSDDDDNNNKDDNDTKNYKNNKDDKDNKGISALGLDNDLGFSRGDHGHQVHQL